MEKILIEQLEMVAEELAKEAKQKKDWGHLGNDFGRSEFKRRVEFWAEVLIAIANNI